MKKKIWLFALLFGVVSITFAQNNEPQADIQFEKTSFDFGDIKQGQVVNATFKFKNTGKSPLILQNVQTTCGCTVPAWPKDPIPPGKSSEITATFNSSGKMGLQNKVITVFSNAKSGQTQVAIICNVTPNDNPTGQ